VVKYKRDIYPRLRDKQKNEKNNTTEKLEDNKKRFDGYEELFLFCFPMMSSRQEKKFADNGRIVFLFMKPFFAVIQISISSCRKC
jgi:hypothetical protein